MGDYARAGPLSKQAMEIWRKTLGENHPNYATSLNNLAGLYSSMGDYVKAEAFFEMAIGIRRKILGENHPLYASSLSNLAMLYQDMGNYAKAEPLLKEAAGTIRNTLGETHPDYGSSLNNLALLYTFMGDYSRAEPLYKQALEIRLKALGENHPDYAVSLNNLAGLYQAMGDYARAEPIYVQAIERNQRLLGQNHPDYAQKLTNLGWLYTAWDKPEKALECFNLGMKSLHGHTMNIIVQLSHDRKLTFLRSSWWKFGIYLSFTLCNPNLPGSASGGALWLARWKALSAEVQTEQYRLLRLAEDAETRKLLEDMESARRELARWTLSPPPTMSFEAVHQRREQSEKKVSDLEDAVARRSVEFAELRRIGSADLAQIAQALPADAVLLDFARFQEFNFKAKGKEKKWGDYRYIVFITPSHFALHAPRSTDQVLLVDLGPAKPIDAAVAAFRSAIESPDAPQIDQPLKVLSKLLLDPILPHVKNRNHLIICPDGQLALVPFECLLTDDGKYLVETYQISYLSAGREAVAYGGAENVGAHQATALLLGDPDFDLSLETQVALAGTGTAPLRGLRASRDLGAVRFDRLPGTRTEAELAAKMLQGNTLLDRQAMEGAVKRASRPDVLYLATHGFFLPDQEVPRDDALGALRGVMIGEERLPAPKARIENPLLRCGLALAGANNRDSVPADSGADDGILTGMEVAGLDLRGTKLVVLSACETGIGDIKQGEGVMGLRRAFLLAGACRVLSTLWKVPDQQTQEMMTDFIKRWQAGTPAVKALREAQLAMVARLRKERGDAPPFFWAAFTMTGDWR
jgi:CHAT domain-containing protein/Tfp pilus assembly protein PilF